MEAFERTQTWVLMLMVQYWPILLYGLVAAVTAIRAYLAPSRPIILFLYGALVLIVAYEYERGSRDSIISMTEYVFAFDLDGGVRRGSQWLLLDVAPICLRILGFGLLAISIVLREVDGRRRSRPRRAIFVDL